MPGPAVTRDLSITYAGVTVGGTSADYLLHGDPPYEIFLEYPTVTVRFAVAVVVDAPTGTQATDDATFVTKCNALENAYRTPNGAFVLALGASNFRSWTHTGNTAMLGRPTCRKRGREGDTGRSRIYDCSITFQMPADLAGKNGLQIASVVLDTPATTKPRKLKVTGIYTASGSTSASAQFEAQIAALMTAVEAVATGNWERQAQSYDRDDENKICKFTATSLEVISNQSSGVLDDTRIKNPTMVVSVGSVGPGDLLDASRLKEVRITYAAEIDQAQTTDLSGLWDSTIKGHLLQHAKTVAGGSTAAITRSDPSFDYVNNRVAAQMSIAVLGTSNIISHRIRTRDTMSEGLIRWAVWNGTPYAKKVFEGPKSWLRTVTEDLVQLGDPDQGSGAGSSIGSAGGIWAGLGMGGSRAGGPIDVFGGLFAGMGSHAGGPSDPFGSLFGADDQGGAGGFGGGGAAAGDKKGFQYLGSDEETDPFVLGIPDAQFSLHVRSSTKFYEYVEVGGGGGGSSGGGGRVSTLPFSG